MNFKLVLVNCREYIVTKAWGKSVNLNTLCRAPEYGSMIPFELVDGGRIWINPETICTFEEVPE